MNEQEVSILLVDDEPNILTSLSRLLRQYQITTATSGEEALQLAKQHKFDIVISDYRMPGINGIEFLMFFKLLQPDAIRLMLTGQADLEGVQQAINEAQVFRFINKPWSNAEILNAIENGLMHQRLLIENKRLADRVREQQTLLNEKDAILRALEAAEPGITKVNWAADGSIIIDENDG
ncbi:MAG: response regulator [Methylomonas sp.]|nr:response regulator [Methylomonas sp.]